MKWLRRLIPPLALLLSIVAGLVYLLDPGIVRVVVHGPARVEVELRGTDYEVGRSRSVLINRWRQLANMPVSVPQGFDGTNTINPGPGQAITIEHRDPMMRCVGLWYEGGGRILEIHTQWQPK